MTCRLGKVAVEEHQNPGHFEKGELSSWTTGPLCMCLMAPHVTQLATHQDWPRTMSAKYCCCRRPTELGVLVQMLKRWLRKRQMQPSRPTPHRLLSINSSSNSNNSRKRCPCGGQSCCPRRACPSTGGPSVCCQASPLAACGVPQLGPAWPLWALLPCLLSGWPELRA